MKVHKTFNLTILKYIKHIMKFPDLKVPRV